MYIALDSRRRGSFNPRPYPLVRRCPSRFRMLASRCIAHRAAAAPAQCVRITYSWSIFLGIKERGTRAPGVDQEGTLEGRNRGETRRKVRESERNDY